MHIDVGDLVTVRKNSQNDAINSCLGIVIKKINPIQGLDKSLHVQHILNSYSPVFYVCSMTGNFVGPYQKSDLRLQQAYCSEIISSIHE